MPQHHWLYGRIGTLKYARKRTDDLVEIPADTKVKVVMVSRFGDIGITTDLSKEFGYELRLAPKHIDFDDLTFLQQKELDQMSEDHMEWLKSQ